MTQQRTRVPIPADVDRDDVVLARLTARQVAILAVVAVVLWLVFIATDAWLPLPVFLGAAAPIAGLGLVLALGRRDGVTLDRLAWAALRQACQPRHLVSTSEVSVSAPPAWVRADDTEPLPAPLRLPAHAITEDGIVDLGPDGAAVVLACSTVNFALATDAEQQARVASFARWLNSLAEPAQVVVRTERVSLTPMAARLEEAAGGLPHLALEEAARECAEFLAQATADDLRARQVLLVLRDPTSDGDAGDASSRLTRRADDAARALQTCGITATVLAGGQARQLVAATCDPYGPAPVGTTTGVVTRRNRETRESDR
ncbi:MAG: PrgI family protein [Streptosporangiales bacterium]|nr:PrgI family protein [Streptosporangiales bacterium]